MKLIGFLIAAALSCQAHADWSGHMTGPKNIDVSYTAENVRHFESANYAAYGELKNDGEAFGIPAIDLHPKSVSYLRFGFTKVDSKTGAVTGDYVGMVRFLESLSNEEFYIDQIDLPSSAESNKGYYDISKTCVRYNYLANLATREMKKRQVYLKGSTLTLGEAIRGDKKDECVIKPLK